MFMTILPQNNDVNGAKLSQNIFHFQSPAVFFPSKLIKLGSGAQQCAGEKHMFVLLGHRTCLYFWATVGLSGNQRTYVKFTGRNSSSSIS